MATKKKDEAANPTNKEFEDGGPLPEATFEAISAAQVAVICSVFADFNPYTLSGTMFDSYEASRTKSIRGFYDMCCEMADADIVDGGDLQWVIWVCRDTATLDVDQKMIYVVGGSSEWKKVAHEAVIRNPSAFLSEPGLEGGNSGSIKDTAEAAPVAQKSTPARRGPVKKAAATEAKEAPTTSTVKDAVAKRVAKKAAPVAASKPAKPAPAKKAVSKTTLAKKRAAQAGS